MAEPIDTLVSRCQRGDRAAFAGLVSETQTQVYNLAYSILRHREEAEDMTQEIYVRAWRALPGFRGDARFSTWLYRIAVNTCLNRRRQMRAQLPVVDSDAILPRLEAEEADPQSVVLDEERKEHIWAMVARLADKYRLVITLFYQNQMSYQEIAEALSLPLGRVKVHLNRARAALARSLRGEQE